jgi:hypothetical protein
MNPNNDEYWRSRDDDDDAGKQVEVNIFKFGKSYGTM